MQRGTGGTRNIVVDNNDNNFVNAKFSYVSKDCLTAGGIGSIVTGYNEVFKIIGLNKGYHNIKRLAFNQNMRGKPVVSDIIKVRISESEVFPNKTNVPLDKTFSVKFDRPVQFDSSIQNLVKVIDSDGKEVPIKVGKSSNPNALDVYAPNGKYEPNSNYTLKILPGIKATSGRELFRLTTMNFRTGSGSRALLRSFYRFEQKSDLKINFD